MSYKKYIATALLPIFTLSFLVIPTSTVGAGFTDTDGTAYKTAKKVGVNGSFTKATYTATDSENLNIFLQSAKAEIDVTSVNSGLPERDEKLLKFFFKTMKKNTILASIQNIKDQNALVLLTMNGVKKEITMKLNVIDNKMVELSGDIDLLNWSLNKQLASINKACSELHEKKTWSEVSLKIEIPISYECHEKI